MPLTQQQIEGFASMGYNFYQQGKFDDARKIFAGLAGIAPDSYYGFAGLGALALASNPPDLEAALTSLKRAAELNANDASTHANLGETLLRQGKLEDAAAEFQKALSLDPEKKDPGVNRARAIISGLKVATEEYKKQAS